MVRANPRRFRAALRDARQERAINEVRTWATARRMAEVNDAFSCHLRSYTCSSRQKLATHAFSVHGVRRRTRDLVDTTHCPVCMQLFHTRVRVVTHLEEKSDKCRSVVMATFNRLPNDVVAELDRKDAKDARERARKGQRPHHADAPAGRLEGPLTLEASEAGLSHKSFPSCFPLYGDPGGADTATASS